MTCADGTFGTRFLNFGPFGTFFTPVPDAFASEVHTP